MVLFAGQIWTDNVIQPIWGTVQKLALDTLFLGGQPDVKLVHELIENCKGKEVSNSARSQATPTTSFCHNYRRVLPPVRICNGGVEPDVVGHDKTTGE